jgi:hypothetical protein
MAKMDGIAQPSRRPGRRTAPTAAVVSRLDADVAEAVCSPTAADVNIRYVVARRHRGKTAYDRNVATAGPRAQTNSPC